MGFEIHTLNFLRYALKKSGGFGKTATIGRQAITILRKKDIKKILNLPQEVDYGIYCENLLQDNFGSVNVDSYDYSDYEDATYTHDMNKPLPSNLVNAEHQYDTIIDFGSLEHIFNLPQAFENLSTMCRDGGVILHALPANNWCGHGFWQFSPELFYSMYSEANGYAETEVFFAGLTDNKHWYKVKKPENGIRRVVGGGSEVYCLVRTKKVKDFSHDNVQQSDFVRAWKGENKGSNDTSLIKKGKEFAKNHPSLLPFLSSLYWQLHGIKYPENLSGRNIHLTKRTVQEWVG
ncbi:MAG: methyltransferase domain-containing protein [Nitrosotalea sp.]